MLAVKHVGHFMAWVYKMESRDVMAKSFGRTNCIFLPPYMEFFSVRIVKWCRSSGVVF